MGVSRTLQSAAFGESGVTEFRIGSFCRENSLPDAKPRKLVAGQELRAGMVQMRLQSAAGIFDISGRVHRSVLSVRAQAGGIEIRPVLCSQKLLAEIISGETNVGSGI